MEAVRKLGMRATRSWRGAVALASVCGLGGCNVEHDPAPTSGEVGPICASCDVAGGQTSDFGSIDGCSLGSGTLLGFDDAQALDYPDLALLTRDFDLPLAWHVLDTTGQPATGYTASTTIHAQTSIASIEHVFPPSETCPLPGSNDFLRVTLDISLETGDRALSVSGQLKSYLRHDVTLPYASGVLDLRDAVGTLLLHPDDWSRPLKGGASVILRFWPEGVRGQLSVELFEGDVDGDQANITYRYNPLDSQFPPDACSFSLWPYASDEAGATPDGRSGNEMLADLRTLLGPEPIPGSWGSAVTSEIGQPTLYCVADRSIDYHAPLAITTSDGTVRVKQTAHGSSVYDASGNLYSAFLEVNADDTVMAADFAAKTGISGIDFGSARAANWYTDLYFAEPDGGPAYGELVVQSVDPDQGDLIGEIARLVWRR
jgi:hypothetical protein